MKKKETRVLFTMVRTAKALFYHLVGPKYVLRTNRCIDWLYLEQAVDEATHEGRSELRVALREALR